MRVQSLLYLLLFTTCSEGIFNPKYSQDVKLSTAVPIDISYHYNNRAFASKPNDGDMDGAGSGYPSSQMPPTNFVYKGVEFEFPNYQDFGNDSIRSSGQVVSVPSGNYFSAHFLAAAESGSLTEGSIITSYADGSSGSVTILVPVWWYDYLFGGDIIFPYYFTSDGVDYNKSMIYMISTRIDPSKELISLQLPDDASGIHIFSFSLWPISTAKRKQLEIQMARSTQKWFAEDRNVQVIEIVVANVGTQWIQSSDSIEVTIKSFAYKTVKPVKIKRLGPGDQMTIEVGVVTTANLGSTGQASVVVTSGIEILATYDFLATFGVIPYEETFDSVYSHESPGWYDDSKYGIFIHWGLFSIPAWGNAGSNETYAEWYWWDMNAGPNTSDETYEFNLDNYGANHTYDDFMKSFTASAWDPKEWVDVFAEAGATYFVQVTKHHDGYALFDSPLSSTLRTSVAQNPRRNFVKELFDAADEYQPQLRKGTYFSLPEWFNPAYGPYGMGRWPGRNATNPYTNETLPYTGFVDVSDFLQDIMLPQLNSLAAMGTDIIWCDAGGANVSVEFAAPWFNSAGLKGRQVVMNNRCGIPGDFDTPEYSKLSISQSRKWESNLGMDPFSYGYNRATTTSSYMNASTIVTTLIDIISKNGNLLLDIGPTGNGSILQTEKDNLLEAGAWIRSHGEAIYNTTYWYITPGEGPIRFTQTLDAFYIHIIEEVNESIVIDYPVPFLPGDRIVTVGGHLPGATVESKLLKNGSLELNPSAAIRNADKFAWIFKITF